MSTITAILEPDADGTLHLPVPDELKSKRVKVVATLEEADATEPKAKFKAGCLKGFWIAPDFDAPLEDFKEYME
ncbi:MAG: DUF2281 domain-containing protein [Akkermansiaceae bacterium]|nr:DUF2281 domain-containing protein [Akkermansiaceae bacterium]